MPAPSSARRPLPSLMRRTISAASSGWLATSSLALAFSYQRKPAMPSLLPCRIPPWLAGVVGGSMAIHGWSVASPLRTSRPSTGARPARIASWSTGRLRPSTWTTSSPGTGSFGPSELAGHEPAHEHAVVRVVVAHGHELREQAVEHGQEHGTPDGRRGVAHVDPRQHPPEDEDGRDLGGQAQDLGDEDRQAARAARGGRRQASCRGPAGASPASASDARPSTFISGITPAVMARARQAPR